MEKVKKKDYSKYCVQYNGKEYRLGDKVMYADGGLYDENGEIVPYAEEAEIVALDICDGYSESDYQIQAIVMLNRVIKNEIYLSDFEESDDIVYKEGAKKYNGWAFLNEIEKIKEIKSSEE